MYRRYRLVSVARRSDRHFYGGTAAQLKTDKEDNAPTLSLPSFKSWARLPQSLPPTSSTPGLQSQRKLGKWSSTRNDETSVPPPSVVDVHKGLPTTTSSLGSQTVRNHSASVRASTTKNHGKRASPTASNEPQNSWTPKHDRSLPASTSNLGKWGLPPHMLPSTTSGSNAASRSSLYPHRHRQSSFPRKSITKATTEPTSKSPTKVSDRHPQSASPRPDYSTFHVHHEYDDPRRAPRRKRDAPARTNLGYNRREEVVNKPPVKKSSKPKTKQIARRRDVFIPTTLTVAMLAKLLNVKLAHLLNRMRRVGMDVEANYDYILSADYAVLLAEDFGFNPVVDDEAAFDIYPPKPHPDPSTLPSRPPIITIMGHVDHGKTTLLDTLRSASVAKGEAGGITQHIGAFSVPVTSHDATTTGPRSITFLDTPGHAAFAAMRTRGANVTDIVVLVVAADDGIMPQTEEVINLLKKDDSDVDLVVAINKIDKPDADPDSVKKGLMAHGVQLEAFGGDIPAVHVSGLTGEGLPDLIETLSTVAEVRDLRADRDGPVYGRVIESNIHKGLGSVATVLIRQGCLKIGSHVISGTTHGKVRRMTDSSGRTIQYAFPGMAITVSGWKMLPKAGDEVLDGSEGDIKKAIANRLRRAENEALQEDAEAINESRRQERESRAEGEDAQVPIANEGPKELKLLIKGDVSGSCEALESALSNIGNRIAVSKVIHGSVGDITESDILMAKAANATIIGFSVSAPRSIISLASQSEVPIVTRNIIYQLIDDVRSRIVEMLPRIIEFKVTGEATVLQLFNITAKSKQIVKVAGCRVINGLVEKQKRARVIRMGHIIHEGSLDTMRQLKKDITEARKGTECGITFKEFSDLKEGDLIQIIERIEKPGVI